MNRHVTDSKYYLGQAVKHAVLGAKMSLRPIRSRIEAFRGPDEPTETRTRREAVLEAVAVAETRVLGTTRAALSNAKVAKARGLARVTRAK